MISVTDIVALAKSGYTVQDVKDLIKMSNEPPKEDPPKEEPPKEDPPKEEPPKEEPPKEEPDYKKLYEESQKALKDAQNNNVNNGYKGPDEDEDLKTLIDITKSFM